MNQRSGSRKYRSPASRAKARRVASLIAGTSIAVLGLTRRSKSGLALAATGGTLAYLGSRPDRSQHEFTAIGSVLVNASPQEAYALYRNFEDFPLFMQHVESITKIGERQYRWVARGPVGVEVRWDAEILQDREGELISWRSLPGSDLNIDGSVHFEKAPGNRGTLVSAVTRFAPSGGKLKHILAKLFSDFPTQQDLRRFKALLETGEIPTVEGQTHGPRSGTTAALRLANPDRPIKGDTSLQEAFNAKRRIA